MIDRQQIVSWLEACAKCHILVIGDVMLDRYLDGSVNRTSPEAPVPVLDLEEINHRPGGAANVALNIRGLGAQVSLISAAGADQRGRELVQLLKDGGVHIRGLVLSEERLTTSKTRVMAGRKHLLRVDEERREPLSPADRSLLLKHVDATLSRGNVQAVILQDYDKGVLDPGSISAILRICHLYDVPVAVDPKFEDFMAYRGVTLFKPNLVELRRGVPFAVSSDEDSLRAAAAYLREKLACTYVMITLSEDGVFIDGDAKSHLAPAPKRTVSDVCGAGDTVISVAALALATGLAIPDMASLAALAGTTACQFAGVVPIRGELLLADI